MRKIPGEGRCSGEMHSSYVDFSCRFEAHDDSSYGFAVDNEAYFAAQEAPDKPPGMMKIPGIIEAALPIGRRSRKQPGKPVSNT